MTIMLPGNSRLKPIMDLELKRPTILEPASDGDGGAGGGTGGGVGAPPPVCCTPRPCDCACAPAPAEMVREVGSVTATGGDAIVNVTAPVPGAYVEETTVEGGFVDRLLPRTPNDWLKLAAGAILGFLLGRKLR